MSAGSFSSQILRLRDESHLTRFRKWQVSRDTIRGWRRAQLGQEVKPRRPSPAPQTLARACTCTHTHAHTLARACPCTHTHRHTRAHTPPSGWRAGLRPPTRRAPENIPRRAKPSPTCTDCCHSPAGMLGTGKHQTPHRKRLLHRRGFRMPVLPASSGPSGPPKAQGQGNALRCPAPRRQFLCPLTLFCLWKERVVDFSRVL